MSYAGDITPAETWEALQKDPKAQLVDVRTTAEWNFVGLPNLAPVGRKALTVEWQSYPSMARNSEFEVQVSAQLKALSVTPETPVFFLCRSGVRSQAAASAMTAAGFKRCFNITNGFEGDPDGDRHRGRKNGWKVSDLPWTQG